MAKVYENIVIGGGAAGLMFAAHITNKKDTLILEGNSKVGAKIEISGGGRCNFTNKYIQASDYLAKKEFIESTLKEYSNRWLLQWLQKRGLEYTVKNSREYFCKNSAKELLAILKKEIVGVRVEHNSTILEVSKERNIFKIKSSKGEFFARRLIVASGGLSFPKLGASDIGFKIAQNFGHKIIPPKAALVGFTLQPQEAFFKQLSGVSLDVLVTLKSRVFEGSLLFAHRGLSGPVILNSSLFWDKGQIVIDFLPHFTFDVIKSNNKLLSNELPLPKRVAKAFLEHLSIEDRAVNKIKVNEWKRLELLKNYSFAPAGTFGFSKAEVTKGGICTEEIDATTFMSKKEENLYFLGEVLDVTGRLGGFNFQWAFASAAKCATNINNIF